MNNSQNGGYYSHSQAKICAQVFFDMGNNLYNSLLPSISEGNTEDTWKVWPAIINISFSCEIILKIFYENDNGEIVRGHKLYHDLYKNLSEKSKRVISEQTVINMLSAGFENYNDINFINDLKESENTFTDERYLFELIPGKSHSLKCGFLLSFSKALNLLSSNLI